MLRRRLHLAVALALAPWLAACRAEGTLVLGNEDGSAPQLGPKFDAPETMEAPPRSPQGPLLLGSGHVATGEEGAGLGAGGVGVEFGHSGGDGGSSGASTASFCTKGPAIGWAQGSTEKVCQFTGDWDRQTNQPTQNRTYTRYGLGATDLGASFEHEGKLWFLFGDSAPTGAGTSNLLDGDAIAHTTDSTVQDCVSLDFVTHPNGVFKSPTVPAIDLGMYNVPLDGVSANGAMYVWFTTDTMSQSFLAKSTDSAQSFSFVHDLSNDHFVNVSAERIPEVRSSGLPGTGDRVVLFGSGLFRHSDVYLAVNSAVEIENRQAVSYFGGVDPSTCAPVWVGSEALAVPLFNQACVGEISVRWIEALGVYVMTYNCDTPRGINFRTAPFPWGPWSAPTVLFHPWLDSGYCNFMHVDWSFRVCDGLQDSNRDFIWGGEYGPYLMPRFTVAGNGEARIYFVMSTWNPYNTLVMTSRLLRSP